MIYLSRNNVEALLDMPACIVSMRSAFQALGSGDVQAPQRTIIRMADRPGFFGSMPIYSPGFGSAAKVMTIYPENHDAGRSSHQGFILLFAEDHGEPLALIEAGSVTELRTAGVSGLATDLMANPGEATLCILGSGVQARSHVKAIQCVRDVTRVQVWSRTRGHADRFAEWVSDHSGLNATVYESPEGALAGANIVCTVTAARDPIVEADWLANGCHVNAVGAFTAATRELDSETIRRARLVVDSRGSAVIEAGDFLIPKGEGVIDEDHIVAELSDLVTGKAVGRQSAEELTVFNSLGLAVEDLVAARAVYDKAVGEGVGSEIE